MKKYQEKAGRRQLQRKRALILRYVISAAVILFTGVAVLLAALGADRVKQAEKEAENYKLIADEANRRAAQASAALETVHALEPETDAPVPETAVQETKAYEADRRYAQIAGIDRLGICVKDAPATCVYESPCADPDAPDSRVVGFACIYSVFNILDEEGDYYQIEYQGNSGYMRKADVMTGDKGKEIAVAFMETAGVAESDGVAAHIFPDDSAPVPYMLEKDRTYQVVDEIGEDWVRINANTGLAFVRRDQIRTWRFNRPVWFAQASGEHVSDLRLAIIEFAFRYLGGAYVWGGETLGEGVDCSGYMLRIFEKFGIFLPRLSAEQSKWGIQVDSMDQILPGDLIFYMRFDKDKDRFIPGVGHVALYVGNGWMIHAASPDRGIVVDKWDNDPRNMPITIRRMIKPEVESSYTAGRAR